MRVDETGKKHVLVQEELSLIKQQLAMMLEKHALVTCICIMMKTWMISLFLEDGYS
ncbi:hypothetical protein DEO72_LG5g2071 [Vigna unguiculata]|uniref:Uncharacterized protein n=1 Tax=Vigna unguiculata TaxID=3917 RepID=A0A4D6LZS6_VIGUN|nr:hypothetical protein DEO72_LG5g2071 [Vigna unguiculata]